MWTKLLLVLAVILTSYCLRSSGIIEGKETVNETHAIMKAPVPIKINSSNYIKTSNPIENMLHLQANTLHTPVINKVLTILKCADEKHLERNNILTIIDYSLPANEKRLWIFDLTTKKLLFNTYVSHGIRSGSLLSTYFSNKYNSKSSSIGTYKTEKVYRGRHGISLQLDGLDSGFNDNAANRAVVMHGGWYVEENFIKKYGRAGRSWGCPAVPDNLSDAIINTIKDNSLFVIYYPSDDWFSKSKFLRCDSLSPTKPNNPLTTIIMPFMMEEDKREDVLFANLHKNGNPEENQMVATMSADTYQQIFHLKAPLTRMLRRQINHTEYIALSNTEFNNLASDNLLKDGLNSVSFVVPVVKMDHGYYGTEMKIIPLGKIIEVKNNDPSSIKNRGTGIYTVVFEGKPSINLHSTDRFVRWLGL